MLLQPPQKVAIRQKLLECLEGERLPDVRHKIGDAVAEIARQYSDNGRRTHEHIAEGRGTDCI